MAREEIIIMEEDYIKFMLSPNDKGEVLNWKGDHLKCIYGIDIELPKMPSLPEGYKIKIYGDLVQEAPDPYLDTLEDVYYITNLRGKEKEDLVIYRSYVRYLKREKELEANKVNIEGTLEDLHQSIRNLGDKIEELYNSANHLKELARLLQLNKRDNTLQ